MNKFILFGIGLILVLVVLSLSIKLTHSTIHFPYKYGEQSNGTIPGTIRIINIAGSSSCSGFVIDKHYAITAAHCIQSAKELEVYSSSETYITKARVAGFDETNDIAVILGDFSDFKPLLVNFDNTQINIYSKFQACGYPLGQRVNYCTSFSAEGFYYSMVKGTGQLYHGMSGGPVIDVTDNVVIGIVTSMDEEFNYITPVQGIFGLFPEME